MGEQLRLFTFDVNTFKPESRWFLRNINKQQAETMLWSRENGTFLIRDHVNQGQDDDGLHRYTLSLVYRWNNPETGRIKKLWNLPIFETERGYGLEKRFGYYHKTLKDLVL